MFSSKEIDESMDSCTHVRELIVQSVHSTDTVGLHSSCTDRTISIDVLSTTDGSGTSSAVDSSVGSSGS